MAGGVGSRFWPLSTTKKPKQFLDVLGSGKTLLQLTFERSLRFCDATNILVVTNKQYENIVQEQLPYIPANNILCEPSRKNTAACVAYGCYKIYAQNKDANILIAPSDHLILKELDYIDAIEKSFEACSANDILVTLGIKTTRPDTGYGYIKSATEPLPGIEALKKVEQFTEKPAHDLAVTYNNDETFHWNSGMFIWSAKSIVNAFKSHALNLHALFVEGIDNDFNSESENSFIEKTYSSCENISIDYAIMEKAKNVYVLPCDIGWTDLGTWGSLHDTIHKDDNQNAKVGNGIKLYDSKNSMICNDTSKVIVAHGLKGQIVVNTKNAVLICNMDDEQKIKSFVNELSDSEFSNLI